MKSMKKIFCDIEYLFPAKCLTEPMELIDKRGNISQFSCKRCKKTVFVNTDDCNHQFGFTFENKLECLDCGEVYDTSIEINKMIEQARQQGRDEGESLFISELMNKNKTPHWLSVFPNLMTITSEKMFSFAEEYSKIKMEQASKLFLSDTGFVSMDDLLTFIALKKKEEK